MNGIKDPAWMKGPADGVECHFETDAELANEHDEAFELYFKDWLREVFCAGGLEELTERIKRNTGYQDLREDAARDGFREWLHDRERCRCQQEAEVSA